MSIFGKLLAVFNVLAAVGFLALAANDWAKRHAWTYSVYLHELALRGIPIDAEESDPADDIPLVEKMSEKTLQQIFQPAGGKPVKTQRDEVKNAQNDLKARIDAIAEEKAKRQELLNALTPLARTNSERGELRTRITAENRPFAEVQSDVDSLFQPGKRAENSLGLLLLPHEEREAIAHLLFSLYPKTEIQQQRLQVVLGVRALDDEVNRQLAALHAMAEQAVATNNRERTNFELAYRAQTEHLKSLAEFLAGRQHALEGHTREKNRHQALFDFRKQEKQQVVEATEAARERHQKILATQRQEEAQIFAAQQLYEKTKRDNEQLESTIRSLEKVDGERKKP